MTMRKTLRYAAALAALGVLALTKAQEPLRAPTLEERICDARAEASPPWRHASAFRARACRTSAARAPPALVARVDAVERSIERLANDLQRVDRLADTAARDAAQARRDATLRSKLSDAAAREIRRHSRRVAARRRLAATSTGRLQDAAG